MGTEPQDGDSRNGYGKTPEKPSDEAAQRQRLFSVVFGVGVAGLVIGGLYLFNSISSEFPKAKDVNTNAQLADEQIMNELKSTDTDKDGLSDYDELFTYNTSPFLKDSDSDGVTDSAEVQKGSDPNCPTELTGKTCGPVATSNTNGNVNASTSSQAAALREALKKSGAPAAVVDATDDQTLLRQYQTSVFGTNSNENTNDSLTNADLSNLSATQVRSLLESNGVDSATLGTVDDETLMTIYYDAISGSDSSSTNASQ